jgi:hypothetical protein
MKIYSKVTKVEHDYYYYYYFAVNVCLLNTYMFTICSEIPFFFCLRMDKGLEESDFSVRAYP